MTKKYGNNELDATVETKKQSEKSFTQISAASEEVRELYKMALLAREKSYSPYSGYKVGSAIRTSDGKIYTGCNVENSSYGATVCAERTAIQKAVSERGFIQVTEVMVLTQADPPWPPCGMCRQVIAEFGKDVTIYTANLQGKMLTFSLKEILPHSFTAENMGRRD